MRNCLVNVDDKEYIPARAIPFVMLNQFSPEGVIAMLACRDPWVSANSFYINDAGALERINPTEWLGVPTPQSYEDLPANAYVLFEDLYSVWENIHPRSWPPLEPGEEVYRMPVTGALLSDEVYGKVMESHKPSLTRGTRKNDREVTEQKILAAVSCIEQICLDEQVPFNTRHIPGTKEQLLDCIKLLEPSITMKCATFADYATRLDLLWDRGTSTPKGQKMVDAVKRR